MPLSSPFIDIFLGLNIVCGVVAFVETFLSSFEARIPQKIERQRRTLRHRSYSQLAKAPIGFLWEMHVLAIHTLPLPPLIISFCYKHRLPVRSCPWKLLRRLLHDHFRLVRYTIGYGKKKRKRNISMFLKHSKNGNITEEQACTILF